MLLSVSGATSRAGKTAAAVTMLRAVPGATAVKFTTTDDTFTGCPRGTPCVVCDIDVPFEKDAIRYFPELSARANQFTRAKSELERRRLAFVVMSGTREARLTLAIRSITDRFPELSSA